ncbi:MAG TPA: Crp/Fnr family transcriptional regulator [Candidatus Sulfotelmatobacter sp.]|nr:Crp/Fnr family transcriptional regulator [Candidatus Sulfotelmatobacter sp.]
MAQSSLLRHLEPAARRRIVGFARTRRYAAGETIFLKGSAGTGMMAVLRGRVRISAPSRQGKEIVLNVIEPGEVFGEIALLDGGDRSADATALTDCELLVLERRDVMAFLETNPKACLKLLETLCQKLRRTTEQVEDILFLELPHRMAKVLVRLTRKDGDRVTLSQRELANLVGGTRESMNKYLGAWKRERYIVVEDGAIRVLDRGALEVVAEGE